MSECELDRGRPVGTDATTAAEVQRLREQVRADAATIRHLEQALRTARVIGTAMGIVMAGERCTADEAFRLLAGRSQHENVKVRELAERVILTGEY